MIQLSSIRNNSNKKKGGIQYEKIDRDCPTYHPHTPSCPIPGVQVQVPARRPYCKDLFVYESWIQVFKKLLYGSWRW